MILFVVAIFICLTNAEMHSDFTVMSPRFRAYIRSQQEVIVGDVLKLNCAAVGKPLPYVHWYRNGKLIVPLSGMALSKDLENAAVFDSSSSNNRIGFSNEQAGNERIKISRFFLKINKIMPGDEGDYACKVWNQAGQIWRNFTVHIVDLSPDHRKSAYYDADQFGFKNNGKEELEKWLGESLDNQKKHSSKNVDESSVEYNNSHDYLNHLPMSDGGSSNKQNASSSSKFATVNQAAPYWTRSQNDMQHIVAVPAGRMIRLTCRANGKPEPHVMWHKDNQEIKSDSLREIGLKYQIKKWALVIEDAVPSDMGIYMCTAFNKYGNISHNYTVEIVERLPVRPIISPEYPKNATVRVGQNATFECPLLSDLQPHIQWYKHTALNGSYISPDGTPYWEPVLSNVFDGLLEGGDATYLPDPTILFIRNVSEDDAGLYTCVAGNQIGFTYASAYLTVLEPVNETYLLLENVEARLTSSTFSTSVLLFLIASTAIILFAIYMKYRGRKRNQEPEKSGDQTILLPKKDGFLSPRYLGNGLKQEFNFHYDSELVLDDQWEISRDDITLIKSCGEGAFGQVFMGELRLRKCQDYPMQTQPQRTRAPSATTATSSDCNQSLVDDVEGGGDEFDHVIVAVKMLKDNATRQEFNDLISEMQVMKQVCQSPKHPNVIDLIGCCTQGGPLYIVFEYCGHGNLLNFLRDLRPKVPIEGSYEEPNSRRLSKKVLTTQDLAQYALQIARGMKYLSEKKCIHRDLAARNVLVSEDYVLKIADFGLARDIAEDDYYRKETDGRVPVKWMAPECLSDKHYTVKSDVWSYGVLLWEIMTLGGKPFLAVHPDNLYQVLKQGQRLCQPHNCPDEIYALMLTCWQDNPDDRWSFAEIEKFLDDLITSNGDEYVEVIADNLDDYESHTNAATVRPLEKICDGLTVPDIRQYFANPKISTLIPTKESRDEQEKADESPVSNDRGQKIEEPRCEAGDQKQDDQEVEEEGDENQEDACDYLASMVLNTPSTFWASWRAPYGSGLGVAGYYHSPLPSPLSRTPLRPISEISELYGSASDDETDHDAGANSNQRKTRPSATDSGNPSSPGCSFEGSSDSMDSKYASSNCSAASSSSGGCPSSSSATTVFDSKFKRHSDPSGDLNRQRSSHDGLGSNRMRASSSDSQQMAECPWPVPPTSRPSFRRRTNQNAVTCPPDQAPKLESDWSAQAVAAAPSANHKRRPLNRLNSADSGHATSSSLSSADSIVGGGGCGSTTFYESRRLPSVGVEDDSDGDGRTEAASVVDYSVLSAKQNRQKVNDDLVVVGDDDDRRSMIPILSRFDKNSDYLTIFVHSKESVV